MKGCKSAEDFYTSRNCDNHSSGCKVGTCVNVHSNCEHVVGSYDKPQETDCHHGSDYSYVAERLFFAGVVGNDVRNHTEAW